MRRPILTLLVFLLVSGACRAAGSGADLRDAIRQRVDRIGTEAGLEMYGESISSVLVIPALYRAREYAPLWQRRESVRQLLDALQSIDADGLDPADYHRDALLRLQDEINGFAPAAPSQYADFDVLLTDSLVRLGYHLLHGKVDPVALDPHWNMEMGVAELSTILAMASAVDDGHVDRLIARLRPQSPIYIQLQDALAGYRRLADAGGWRPVAGGPSIKPGMSDARVPDLRKRLAVTGEYRGTDRESLLYDPGIEAAVVRFQQRHALEDDGVVGRKTLQELNVPVEQYIDRLRVNLERARWILRNLPREYVLVDIAGFQVELVKDGRVLWETRAVVGRPYRKTPVFRSEITYMEVNPTWTIPPTILRKDVLPAIREDPEYLQKKNMRVLDREGREIDPAGIDWSRYPGSGFPYQIRQDPGPENALGRIKFMFPNKYSVYLHDTPSKSLFDKNHRAFSSGCIRIEKPYEFAELLMNDPEKWGQGAIHAVVDRLETRTITLPKPVAVLLLYWTVGFDADGDLIIKQDIYDRDAAILAGLQQPFRFRDRPVMTGTTRRPLPYLSRTGS